MQILTYYIDIIKLDRLHSTSKQRYKPSNLLKLAMLGKNFLEIFGRIKKHLTTTRIVKYMRTHVYKTIRDSRFINQQGSAIVIFLTLFAD